MGACSASSWVVHRFTDFLDTSKPIISDQHFPCQSSNVYMALWKRQGELHLLAEIRWYLVVQLVTSFVRAVMVVYVYIYMLQEDPWGGVTFQFFFPFHHCHYIYFSTYEVCVAHYEISSQPDTMWASIFSCSCPQSLQKTDWLQMVQLLISNPTEARANMKWLVSIRSMRLLGVIRMSITYFGLRNK
jgi:hypothetical protein